MDEGGEKLVTVVINDMEKFQFYATNEHFKTFFQDDNALFNTVKSAFADGIAVSEIIQKVEDLQSVKLDHYESCGPFEVCEATEVCEVDEGEGVVRCEMEAPTEGEYESIQIIAEETTLDNLTSSALPEELMMDGGLSSDERLNLCAYCDYRTFNVGHFKIHMRQHTGESPFECNFCDYRSKQKSNLKRHMRQHIEGKDHFECKMCSFTCTQEKVYKRHMILHSRSRPLRPCPFCDYFSTSLAHLTVHIRQHTGETPYHCGLCPYKTVQKSNLTRHLKKHRRGRISKADKLRCCLYCSYRTPNPAHLLAHIRAAHTGETPYACQHCSYKSAQRSNLKRHLRKHTGERPYKCNLCSYSTAYPYVLKKHIENHPSADEKLQCDFCEFFTFSTADFRKHGKYHVENDSLLCCHICGALSVNSDNLKAHMKTHTLDKPFKCHYCRYGSIQKSNLKRHLLLKHSGVSQNDEVNKTSNSEEGVLKNKKQEILNVDSSNSGTLPEDKLHQSYIDGSGEEILESNESNIQNEEIEKDQSYHTDPAYLNDYSNNAEESVVENDAQSSYDNENENENDTETVEVVSEEHVITTPMEGYEVSEEYDEGSAGDVIGNTTDEVERSPKKNLSFLNKLQAEKLKEFKRLLQQGTQSAQSGLSTSRSQTEENIRHNSSGEIDNASENTESCTEEPPLEEELHDPPTHQDIPEEEFHNSNIAQNNGNDNNREERSISCRHHIPHVPSREIPENGDQHLSEVVEGPILIVDHTLDEEGNLGESLDNDEYGSETSHVCKLCEFAAETLLELKNHIGVHTGETTVKGFFCDLCPFKSIREIDISRHKNLFHGASPPKRLPFVCGICEYRTGSKEDFLEHNKRHKGDPFRCKICEKKLSNAEEYKHHSREHIGEEPFECYYCAYLTARKCHLRKHMRKHEGTLGGKGPPYQCYTCGFNTDHRVDFLKHTGTHKIQQTVRHTCPHCLFMTLDEEVFNNHKRLHEKGGTKKEDNSSNNVKSIGEQTMLSTNVVIKKERIPLKEWMINVPESEEMKVKNVLLKRASLLDKNSLYKHKLKEDYSSISPVKRRRKNLKSLTNCSGTSVVEARLTKKFKFNIRNLCSSAETNPGYHVDFFGEVLKSHGSLRKYTNYAEICHKSENEMVTVLSNVENDEELKRVYAKFKDVMLSHKNADKEILSFQFTIYFKEIEEIIKTPDETFSDIDLSLSSGDESDQNSINDLDSSDLDLDDLSPSNTPRPSAVENKPDSPLESSKPTVSTKVSKAPEPLRKDSNSEFVFNLDRADKVKFLQDKIKERNERMKELRRLKALGGYPRDVKKELNGIVPKMEPVVEPMEEDADDGRLVIEE